MANNSIVKSARRPETTSDGRRKRLSRYRGATALAGGLLAMLAFASPAAAQETSGGAGAGPTGGAGGGSSAGGIAGNGGNGGAGGDGGGGGGGAGPSGGSGGTGEGGAGTEPGASGGGSPGANGGDGTSNLYGGSGGGGGAHGYVDVGLPTNAVSGGNGGRGGFGQYGGGGGAGGYGAVITGGVSDTLSFSVTGGNGGGGASGSSGTSIGGQGGHGLFFTGASTVTIAANVSGGVGGDTVGGGIANVGGYGIIGSDLTLTIGAVVSGGFDGTFATRNYALYFTGGANSVTMDGGSLLGGIRIEGGSLALDGNGSMSGGISVNGTLRLLSSGAAGGAGNTITTTGSVISYADGVDNATPIIINSNDTQLEVLGTDVATQSGVISETGGSRPIEKIGAGTLILAAANTYTGPTTITGGTLRFGINNAININSDLIIGAVGTLDLAGFNAQFASFSGDGTLTLGGGRFDTGYDGTSTIFGGTISGAGTFGKQGPGTLEITGLIDMPTDANGLISVGSGTLAITSSATVSAWLIQNFGVLTNAGAMTVGTAQNFGNFTNSGSIVGNTQNFNVFDNSGTMQSLNNLGGTATNSGTIDGFVNNFTSFTSTGIINGSLNNFGTTQLQGQLNGALSNFSGTVTLTGAVTGITDYSGQSGGVAFDLAGFDTSVASIAGSGAITLGGATLTVDQISAGTFTFAGEISGGGALTKAGAGTLILTGNNSYGGATTVSGGILLVGDGGTTGTLGGGDINIYGGTLVFNRGDAVTYANALNMYGTLVTAGAGEVVLLGSNFVQGAIRLDAGRLAFNSPVFYDEGSLLTFNGGSLRQGVDQTWDGFLALRWNAQDTSVLSVANGATLTIYSTLSLENGVNGNPTLTFGNSADTGTIILNSAADFTPDGTGALVVRGGTLTTQFGNDVLNVLASGLGSVEIYSGTLDLSDAADFTDSQAIRSLLGDGNLIIGASTRVLAGEFYGAISGGGSLTKIGEGTLSLYGFNSYSGTTSVLEGTLAFNDASLFGTSLIEIDNGATIKALGFFAFIPGDILIGEGGGTIDTGVGSIDHFGSVNFAGLLTKTGAGILFLNDGNDTTEGEGGIDVREGTLALGGDFAAGFGTISLADGTTLMNAACFCGILELDNNIAVAANGTATIDGQGLDTILNGILSGGNINFVSGTGQQQSEGGGSFFYLTNTNTYGATRIGPNVALILTGDPFGGDTSGTLGTGDTIFDSAPSNPMTPATLVFANTMDYTYGGAIIGNGEIFVQTFDPETVITLAGSNSSGNNFTGTVTVQSGRLNIDGNFGDIDNLTAELLLDACSCNPEDATLGGSGTFFGNVTINNGTLSVGNSPGTLNIAGNLTLGAGTVLNFEFGQPGVVGNNVNDFVTVGGNLTLDGTLNILNFGPSYGPGYYALFRYGTLTDNGLTIGTVAGGLSTTLLFNIPGQINLLLGSQVIQYWDGPDTTGVAAGSGATNGNGGNGTWSANPLNSNWTAASGFGVNDGWRSTVGVFAGAAGGTVLVDGNVAFQELRFETDNYLLRPNGFADTLSTTGGFSIIQVNPGLTADIGVEISGAAGLTKTGTGTLILSASNSYAGATNIAAGTLRMGDAFVLPSTTAVTVAAGATLDLGAFNQQFGSLAGAGSVLGTGGFDTGGDNSSTTFSGTIDVGGFVSKSGTGNWTLTGTNSVLDLSLYDGTVTIAGPSVLNGAVTVYGFAGTPTLINDGTINGRLTAYGGNTDNNGTINGLVENRTNTFVNDGTIRGTGFYTLFNIFGGVFTNNGLIEGRVQNAEFGGGGTLINAGTITGFVENVTGGVINSTGTINGTLNNYGTVSLAGQLNGALINQTNGTATLTGTTTGITSYNGQPGAAVLDLANFDTAIDSITGEGEIRLGSAILTIGANDAFSAFGGVISGSGSLTKIGNDTAFLSGANTFTGLTTVEGGLLDISSTGSLAGDVLNNARFDNAGTVGGTLENNGTSFNSGTINEFVINRGTFTTTGIINPLVSGLALHNDPGGTVNARGQINGVVQNNTTFNVTGALTGITRFNQFGSASLNLQGNNLSVGGLGGSGTVTLGSATLTVGVGNLNSTYGGVISGSGGLTKVGTDLFTLSGANTYTGTTTVSAGTLRVAGSGVIAGPVVNNATLENFATINGLVTNNSIYTQVGALNGGLTNNGTASIRGTLNGAVNNQSGTITLTGALTGLPTFNQSAGATFNLAGFDASVGSLAGAGSVQLGTGTLSVGGNGVSTTFAGVISGTGASGLTKVGVGTLTLSGANTYTGLTTVSAGILQVGDGGTNGALGGGNIVVNGTLRFSRSDTVTINSVITGNGLIENIGSGTLALPGSQPVGADFTGTLRIQNGALLLNGAFGDRTGNTAQLIVDSGSTFSGTGTFLGSATVNGVLNPGNSPGTMTIAGNLTLGGGAVLNYEFGLPGTVGGASNDLVLVGGNLTLDGTLNVAAFGPSYAAGYYRLFNYGGTLTDNGLVGGTIAGGLPATVLTNIAGQVNVRLGAQVIQYWDGADTTGATTTANGEGGAGTWGSGTNWTAGTGFGINDSWRATTGVFGGLAGGNVTVVGTQAFQELRFITNGYVLSGAGAADGLATTAGFSIIDVSATQATIAAPISGTAGLTKTGAGTLILAGANTYTGATTISAGTLQLGNGGATGSIVGAVQNNATLIVNRNNALTLGGAISGTGLFIQAGTGTTTLTGANTYIGGTQVQAGRLRGDVASLQGDIQNAATLEFAQATAGTFTGRLFGAGAVESTGAGLLTFTTDNSNLTGNTSVLAGELRVNGLLSRSRVTVGTGATLSGTGTVGGIIAQSGGTVAPGAGGFGTLNINGNTQFLAGSTFAAQVQPSGSDLLLGTGTAQLAGTIAVAGTPGVYQFNRVYVLLQADGGRTGTFTTEAGLNSFGPAFLPRIVYTPTQVQLLLAPNQLLNVVGTAGTPNQRSTLQRIDAAVAAGYDPQPLIALFNLTPQAALLNGADQLSGEIYATSTRVALDDERLVREATFGRLRLTQDMGFGEGFGAWGQAVASWGSGDSDGNAARYERDRQGFVVGIDGGGVWDGGSWRLGLLGHHVRTDIDVDDRGSSADLDRAGGGIYAGFEFGELRIRLGGTYSSLDLDARRVAAFTGFTETLVGETDGSALQGFGEIAYRFQVGAATHVEPFFQISLAHVEFDAFSETGGVSRLRVAEEEDDLTMLGLGLRGGTLVPLGGSTQLRLDGSLGLRHLSGDRMIFSLIGIEVSPNQSFDIRSAALDRTAMTGTLDATFEFGRAVSLTVGYSGVVGADARDHAARATLGVRF